MNDTDLATLSEPSSDEKTMATLAQVLQIIGSWIAPLIIYLIKRDSKFVSFHAVQALLWQIMVLIIWMITMVVWFGVIFSLVFAHGGHPQPSNVPPVRIFLGFGAIWLAVMIIGVTNLFLGIFYGIKASNGKWAEYPIIGKLARRIVGV
jgi:uncharacterized Tic20 family protein